MPKSLLLVFSALLLAAPYALAAGPSDTASTISSGRSATGPEASREAWFGRAVGDILEGRVETDGATPPGPDSR